MNKTNKLKACRMWANIYPGVIYCYPGRVDAMLRGDPNHHRAVRVAVIPLDDVDELVEAATKVISAGPHRDDMAFARRDARKVLTAIGVLPKQRKDRK